MKSSLRYPSSVFPLYRYILKTNNKNLKKVNIQIHSSHSVSPCGSLSFSIRTWTIKFRSADWGARGEGGQQRSNLSCTVVPSRPAEYNYAVHCTVSDVSSRRTELCSLAENNCTVYAWFSLHRLPDTNIHVRKKQERRIAQPNPMPKQSKAKGLALYVPKATNGSPLIDRLKPILKLNKKHPNPTPRPLPCE